MQRQGEFYIRLIQTTKDVGYLSWVMYRKTGWNTYEIADEGNYMLPFYAPLPKHDRILKHGKNCYIKVVSNAEYNQKYRTQHLWLMPLRR